MRVGVIGAGPAGLTAALSLQTGGADVEVLEASSSVGGLSRSIDLWGQRVDIGPHRFFSTDERINRFWLDVVGENYRMVERLTRVCFRGELIDYPIRPLGAMRQLGWLDAARCLSSYVHQKLVPPRQTQAPSFESWVTSRFGHRLFEMFFQSYSEKLWGIPCHELSADFAAQRIREFSLGAAVLSSIFPNRAQHHKTLADRFAYPIGGTGSVYETMAKRLQNRGGLLQLNSPVAKVLHEGGKVHGVQLISGEQKQFDHVVSTMPLSLLVQGLSNQDDQVPQQVKTAVDALTFRNTILVYLHVDSDSLFDDQWLYVQSPEVGIGRVTNFRNWIPELRGKSNSTVLAVERWCNNDDPDWSASDHDLIGLCSDELCSIGLLRAETVLDGFVMRIERSYPIYRIGYQAHIACIAEYLSGLSGITPIGRNGAFKYNNQDHSILMGLLASENVLHDAGHDLWNVNSDFDSYQERTVITETGLVSHGH
ncbi:MAG: FAD-dependent oxidoreductase [Rubripirellula sp.]